MSMSTYLELYSDDPKKKNQKMVEALDALNDAGITTLPKEMADYFKVPLDTNPNEVDPNKMLILIASASIYSDNKSLPQGVHIVDQEEQDEDGFIVTLEELPKEVKFIKFWNSW